MRPFLKNSIVFLITVSVLLNGLFLIPEKSSALSESGPISFPSSGEGGTGINGILDKACGVMSGAFSPSGIVGGLASAASNIGADIFNLSASGPPGNAVPTNDVGLNPKEKCLDSIAWFAAKFIIRKMVDDLTLWLREGANGKPRFIQDFGAFLFDAADNAGGLLLEKVFGADSANMLCEPWKAQVAFDVFRFDFNRNRFETEAQCKISEIVGNIEDFYNDFSRGGWGAFLTMALDSGSNPIGSFLLLSAEKDRRQEAAIEQAKLEATVNKGILPGVCINSIAGNVSGSNRRFCQQSMIFTPGAAIEETLVNVFGSDLKQLELADELNELIAAAFDAIRMKRLWRQGIAGREGTEFTGFFGLRDIPDAEDWNPGSQLPSTISPKNKEQIVSPIKFDWSDFEMAGVDVAGYVIIITNPNGTEREPIIITEKLTVDGVATNIPISEYQMTEAEFNAFTEGGTYLWKVAALSPDRNVIGGELGGFSNESKFIIPMPNIQNPTEGEIHKTRIRFNWTKIDVDEVSYYKVEIFGNFTDGTTEKSITVSNEEKSEYKQTEEGFKQMLGGDYVWRVAAYGADDKIIGRHSPETNFQVLAAPTLTSPAEEAEISLPFTFDWSDVPLAGQYTLGIKGIKNKDGVPIQDAVWRKFDAETSGLTMSEIGQNRGGEYAWRARAEMLDEEGETIKTGEWSEQRRFILNADIPIPDIP